MTQSELAEVLGVTQTSVSQWEGGRNYPDIKTAKRMAEMFGATLDQILGAEEMDDALLSPVASIWLDDTWNSEDGGDLVSLEQKARLLAIMSIERDLDVLGPLGAYLTDRVGTAASRGLLLAAIAAWTAAPLAIAARGFSRQDA